MRSTSYRSAADWRLHNLLHRIINWYRHRRAVRDAKLLVDESYYKAMYPEAANYLGGPVGHYFEKGWKKGYNPSSTFDTSCYLESNLDVLQAGTNPLYHYVRYGRAEGRLSYPPASNNTSYKTSMLSEADICNEVDPVYYLARNPDVASSGQDPFMHYLQWGLTENRQPNVNFDVDFYRKVAAEVLSDGQSPHHHYISVGRNIGIPKSRFSSGSQEFDRFCRAHGWDANEVEKKLDDRRQDLVDRLLTGDLGSQLKKLSEIDPLIMGSFDAALEAQYSPFRSVAGLSRISSIIELMAAAEWRQTDVVVVLPWSRMGGASKLAGVACKVLVDRFGSDKVTVLHTSESQFDYSHWFPEGIRIVDFYSATLALPPDARRRVLFEFLRALRPAIVLNINSQICWEVIEEYGRPLQATCKLLAYMFCHEVDSRGHLGGYPVRSYHRSLPYLHAALVDSQALRDELIKRYCLFHESLSRLYILPTPTDPLLPYIHVTQRSSQWRPNVFWAGRFVAQKRLDLLQEIATRMPDVNFHVWGGDKWPRDRPQNVYLRGSYQRIGDLPLQDCDLWLYTSGWDGVPNVLIEVATLGIPLVGSVVGGTGEVLIDGMSVPIVNVDDIEAYIEGIRSILADIPAARERSAKLRAYIMATRSPLDYSKEFNNVLSSIESSA